MTSIQKSQLWAGFATGQVCTRTLKPVKLVKQVSSGNVWLCLVTSLITGVQFTMPYSERSINDNYSLIDNNLHP